LKQAIHIIGGHYRGKKIQFPESTSLRPTPNRIRETLFNWLMHDIRGARCLDTFAGSGALGFEAYSRGASEVVFLEQSPLVHTCLQKNIALFQSDALSIKKTDALVYLDAIQSPFDIIFLDPPFSKEYIPQCMQLIQDNEL
jgi:16S rRNA (guanine966-N2)-methyltransferase